MLCQTQAHTALALHIAENVQLTHTDNESSSLKRYRASFTHHLTAKSSTKPKLHSSSSRSALQDPVPALSSTSDDERCHSGRSQRLHDRSLQHSEKLLNQVADWLKREQSKVSRRRKKLRASRRQPPEDPAELTKDRSEDSRNGRGRASSVESHASDVYLDKLQDILEDSIAHMNLEAFHHATSRLTGLKSFASRASLHRAASSDTDYADGDAIVPDCDAWLDNSKTLEFPASGLSSEDLTHKLDKERDAWLSFKNEIIRITHTLRLRGWRRVPLGSGHSIQVERLSGALTNAVYVVSPPHESVEEGRRRAPAKILLRIYGPQVEHLIDRENELKVLQRLARKKIGPRLLGTFRNGRFEEFFNAITLRCVDLRDPETSRQIAKRMRELHDGIDLLATERENGPGVWRNWDQWQKSATKILTYLDDLFERKTRPVHGTVAAGPWMANGYVFGVPWAQFRGAVAKYREHLDKTYQSRKDIRNRLVFAHNDTQYGNILRVKPIDDKSPLLQPANKHKQLIVIDFEYAAANTRGFEFADHFTEWMYNYHDAVASFASNTALYPTLEEQKQFIKAYVDHRPQFPSASATPRMRPVDDASPSSDAHVPPLIPTSSSSSIIDFMLDARTPTGGWHATEREREERSEKQVRQLLDETRLWRPANNAQWAIWGVVRAKVLGLAGIGATQDAELEVLDGDEGLMADEFDYLSHAQNRALLFWADVVQMGLVALDELPETLQARLKVIEC